MELDKLKHNWIKSGEKLSTPSYDLQKLTSLKGSGILKTLKDKYKKQVILLCLASCFLVCAMIKRPVLRETPFIWFIVPVMILFALMYYRNYILVSKIEQTSAESLQKSIRENINLLNKNAEQQLSFTRILLVCYLLVLEFGMYFQQITAFIFWKETPIFFRIATYLFILVVQPYLTRYFFNLNFGRYIKRLQELLDQTF